MGRRIAEFHSAAGSFVPRTEARWDVAIKPDSESLICHHDLAPWNLIREGDRRVFVDWDGSGRGSRLWDLAFAAQRFAPLAARSKYDLGTQALRLRLLVDGYGLNRTQRKALPRMIAERTAAMYQLGG